MSVFSIAPNAGVTFKVYFEDADVAVVGKPARVVTTPGLGHDTDTLQNGLFSRWGQQLQQLGKDRDFGLLQRLDKDTSGLVLVALSARAHTGLREQFEQRKVRKFYWAVVRSCPKEPTGVIRRAIAESEPGRNDSGSGTRRKTSGRSRMKLAKLSASGKPAVTAYRVLSSVGSASIVECRTLTGRLHQVRVHMKLIGCPILGDALYAPESVSSASPRLALHAHRIVFNHPASGDTIDVTTRWPADLRGLLKRFHLPRPDLEPESESGEAGEAV